jgi:hypothetical protein
MLGVARREYSPFACPLWTDEPLVKRRRGPHGGTAGPGRSPVGLPMQPPNEEFFTLFSEAGSSIVESLAIPLRDPMTRADLLRAMPEVAQIGAERAAEQLRPHWRD